MAPWGLVFGNLDGDPEGLFFTPVDDTWMQDVDAPLIVDGRTFDPEADDELLVAEAFAAAEGIQVGDTIPFTPYTVDDEEGAARRSRDRRSRCASSASCAPRSRSSSSRTASWSPRPGSSTDHPEVKFFENAFVQLVDPETGAAALEAHATADITAGVPVLDLHIVARRVTATTDVQRSALLLLAGAIALAGLVLAGQVVIRSASLIGRDARDPRGGRACAGAPVAAAALLSHVPADRRGRGHLRAHRGGDLAVAAVRPGPAPRTRPRRAPRRRSSWCRGCSCSSPRWPSGSSPAPAPPAGPTRPPPATPAASSTGSAATPPSPSASARRWPSARAAAAAPSRCDPRCWAPSSGCSAWPAPSRWMRA